MLEKVEAPCEGLEVTVPALSACTFKYTWRIHKYGKQKKDSFDSVPFECNANGDRTRWNLSIRYWKGKEGKRLASPIVMCLNLLDSAVRVAGQATVSYEFGVFNTATSQWETCPKSRTVLYLPSTSDILSVGYRDLHINKPHLGPGTSTLTVYVKIQLDFTDEEPGNSLQQDMSKLLSEGHITGDITLKCAEGKTIRAHLYILAARSPVLRDMLRCGTTLDVDLAEDAAKQMLHYIYTDNADLAGSATLLISIAHRFSLLGLKDKCEKYLVDNISASNVPSLLLVAEQFHCDSLKRSLLNYCEGNATVIQKNMTWKVLEMVNPELFEEVCEAGLGSSVSSNMDSLPSDPETP